MKQVLNFVGNNKLIFFSDDPAESLKWAFLKTNNAMKEARIKGGTTALVALFHKNDLYVANAGDSRAVLCKEGRTVRVTVDHKPDVPGTEIIIRIKR